MVGIKSYLEHLEWDFLQNKFQIDDITLNTNIPQNIERIEVWRDKYYNIKARLFATEKRDSNKDYLKESIPGKSSESFTIKGSADFGSIDVELRNCFIESYETSWDERDGSDTEKIELDILISGMKLNMVNISESVRLTDWYLNAPHNLYLPRLTKRNISLDYKKLRKSVEEANSEYIRSESSGSGYDFAFVDANQVKFIISKVDDDFGPEWSNKIGIEYIKKIGSIPEKETRESINEIVSFILGKQLLHVGYTKYNNDGQIVESFVKSPWTKNTVSLCQELECRPINIRMGKPMEIEKVLKQIVPSYLQLRNELNLNETLYFYWTSIDSPIWANLPIISAALEGLIKKCIKSNKFKIKSVYMDNKEFNTLLYEEMTKISEKLDKKEFGDKIFSKIKNSYNMSASYRFLHFFDCINLKIDKIEKTAINARHSVAHGGIKFDYESFEKIIPVKHAYLTLFNRTFLKILGYDGNYIDMSTIGFPERHIDVQLGGDKK